MPEHRAGDLPAVQGIAKRVIVDLYGQFIDILAVRLCRMS